MPAPLSPPSAAKDAGRLDFRTRQLERRPVPELIVGPAIYAIEVVENYDTLVVNDDQFNWMIPEDLDGAVLLKVEGYVNTASASGNVEVMVTKVPDSGIPADMLTDPIVIPAGELNSFEPGGEQSVVDPAEEEVVHGDHLRIDVDAAGSGTLGLGIILYFVPLRTKALIVQGAKGDTGGVNNWTGEYDGGETYSEGDSVTNGGTSYVATVDNPTTEPGVDVGWEDEWQVLVERQLYTALTVIDNNQEQVLDVGTKAMVHFPFAATIVGWTLLANVVGDLELDLQVDSYANFPPDSADSIVAAAPPQLVAERKAQATALTGWTPAIAEDDVLIVSVVSASLVTFFSLTLKLERT